MKQTTMCLLSGFMGAIFAMACGVVDGNNVGGKSAYADNISSSEDSNNEDDFIDENEEDSINENNEDDSNVGLRTTVYELECQEEDDPSLGSTILLDEEITPENLVSIVSWREREDSSREITFNSYNTYDGLRIGLHCYLAEDKFKIAVTTRI